MGDNGDNQVNNNALNSSVNGELASLVFEEDAEEHEFITNQLFDDGILDDLTDDGVEDYLV